MIALLSLLAYLDVCWSSRPANPTCASSEKSEAYGVDDTSVLQLRSTSSDLCDAIASGTSAQICHQCSTQLDKVAYQICWDCHHELSKLSVGPVLQLEHAESLLQRGEHRTELSVGGSKCDCHTVCWRTCTSVNCWRAWEVTVCYETCVNNFNPIRHAMSDVCT